MPTYHKIANNAPLFADQIADGCAKLGLLITTQQSDALLAYLDRLLLWSKAYNLTAITAPQEALTKHIMDCLAVLPVFDAHAKPQCKLLDIGTGAGLPAVIFAIMRPDWQVSALDSNQKKIRFVRQVKTELGLQALNALAMRIDAHAGTYDVITSRAFASLCDFVQAGAGLLSNQGALIAMKGKIPHDEIQGLGAWDIQTVSVSVPNLSDDRSVVVLKPL